MMRNFVYSGGLSGGLLRHIKNDFLAFFQNEVKSVLNIKESYSIKETEKMFKKIRIEFYKTSGGGGQRPFIKFIQKQEIWYRTASLRGFYLDQIR